MSDLGIVVVGYNRVKSIERLLDSLLAADYDGDIIDLLISIDNSGKDDVYEFAKSFSWPYGEKKVYTYQKRLGLRQHILQCGSFLNEYEAIIVLEDDLFVAPGFYQYAKEAVEFYKDDDRIAGISLYNHMWNVNCRRNFQPEPTQYDSYFMQFAQSWGQVWIKRQWKAFAQWYEKNIDFVMTEDKYPKFVMSWPETSWLKYHIMYCVENEKYFVYPYQALSTCFSDVGEHSDIKSNLFQVPLLQYSRKKYAFMDLDEAAVCYDVFFERQGLGKFLGVDSEELCVNIYGEKRCVMQRYQLTTLNLSKDIIKTFALELRPHEQNIRYGLEGKDIFLYDMQSEQSVSKNRGEMKQYMYYQKISGNEWRIMLKIAYTQIKENLLAIIREIRKKK